MTADITQLNNVTNDEILIKDESGQFQILSGGKLRPYNNNEEVGTIKSEMEEGGLKPILPIDTGMEEKMLQPPPPMIKKTTASFYFHPADEEEAAKHQAAAVSGMPKKVYSLDKILAKVVENYQLKLSEELTKRLRSIIFSFLRDRRTLVDTHEVLARPETNGGLNLTEFVVANLLEFLKEIKEKIQLPGGVVIDEQKEAGKKAFTYVPPNLPENLAKRSPIAKMVASEEVKPVVKDIVRPIAKAMPVLQRPLKKGSQRLADVKRDYKLVGPVEELGMLNLETFRRLGEITASRAQKVLSKINFLAEESITKKTAGIRAWRSCPLYRMYVAIGQASMEHNLGVEQVVSEYQAKGREIISLEEFEAISDLNRQLRF